MRLFIPQTSLKLIIFLNIIGLLTACTTNTAAHLQTGYEVRELRIPSGEILRTYIAKTHAQQKRGLSGIKPTDFSETEAMFFPGDDMYVRQFWMPETYFDLDLFFLNENLIVLDIHRGLKHYPKKGDRSEVPLSKEVYSQHVLEIRTDSPLAKKIQPGMVLKFLNLKNKN